MGNGQGGMCYSPTAAVAVQSLQRVLIAHHGDIRAAGGCAVALMLLRIGLAGGRSNDDGRRQAAFAGAGTVGGLLWFLGACWLGQLSAARAKLAELKDFLETEDALRFLL